MIQEPYIASKKETESASEGIHSQQKMEDLAKLETLDEVSSKGFQSGGNYLCSNISVHLIKTYHSESYKGHNGFTKYG